MATEIQRTNEKRIDAVMARIRAELIRAMGIYEPHVSLHHSHSVLEEEYDELWTDIKNNSWPNALKEAVQVGAMAARLIHDQKERMGLPVL